MGWNHQLDKLHSPAKMFHKLCKLRLSVLSRERETPCAGPLREAWEAEQWELDCFEGVALKSSYETWLCHLRLEIVNHFQHFLPWFVGVFPFTYHLLFLKIVGIGPRSILFVQAERSQLPAVTPGCQDKGQGYKKIHETPDVTTFCKQSWLIWAMDLQCGSQHIYVQKEALLSA